MKMVIMLGMKTTTAHLKMIIMIRIVMIFAVICFFVCRDLKCVQAIFNKSLYLFFVFVLNLLNIVQIF